MELPLPKQGRTREHFRILLPFLLLAPSAFGRANPGDFIAPTEFVVGVDTGSSVQGDFNRDGRPDIAAVAGKRISMVISHGDGTFAPPIFTDIQTNSTSSIISTGDFNCDGNLDLLLAVLAPDATAQLYTGDGQGGFTPGAKVPLAKQSPGSGDFNGDGKLDVVGVGNASISVFLGHGDGGFAPAITSLFPSHTNNPPAIGVGDLDRDGRVDVLAEYAVYGQNLVFSLMGQGDGRFVEKDSGVVVEMPSTAGGMLLADLDHDGILDFVDQYYEVFDQKIRVFPGMGDGTFGNRHIYAIDTLEGFFPVAADTEKDGYPNLFLPSYGGPLREMVNQHDGTFAPPILLVAGSTANVVAADFNSDGLVDLATTNSNSMDSNLSGSLLLNRGRGHFVQPAPPVAAGYASVETIPPVNGVFGDFNGDGRLDVAVANGTLLLGTGVGRFQTPRDLGVTGQTRTTGDANGDGIEDLVYVVPAGIQILRGLGDGTFAAPLLIPLDGVLTAVSLTDIDKDGRSDLLVLNRLENCLVVFYGAGDGAFLPKVQFPVGQETGPSNGPLTVDDLNGDGWPDLVVVQAQGMNVLLSSQGGHDFQSTAFLPNGDGTYSDEAIATGDFNRDGRRDLVVGVFQFGSATEGVHYYAGQGDGTFAALVSLEVISYVNALTVKDLNDDQIEDLIACGGNGDVGVALGRGDGTFQPPERYLAGVACASVYAGPLTGVNRNSLVTLTRDWTSSQFAVTALLPDPQR